MTRASDRPSVGPILSKGRNADAVVAAILELNLEAEVVDRGAYLRVSVPGSCRVTRQAIEKHAGEPFVFPSDLEMIMPSFQGRLAFDDDAVTWTFGEQGDK
ncbi:MAG: MmoB/DmpM family protein [Polyangiaceae bacterium]